MDGISAIQSILSNSPEIEIIALTSVLEDASVMGAMRAGATGYLLKNTQADELCRAIKAAAAGQAQSAAGRQPVDPEVPVAVKPRKTD